MNKINYSTSMAPILDGLFNKFIQTGTLNYCIICLRTERRLVKDRTFKKFAAEMKINKKYWQHHQICYICERQAMNALKFLNAATFAAAIDTIFTDIVYKRKNYKKNVSQNDLFNRTLKKYGLDIYKASAHEWDIELEAIRKSTQLIETQPLVVDNLNCNMVTSVQNPAAPEELYVIPDNPPASLGEFTGLATRHPGVTSEQSRKSPQPVFGATMPDMGNSNNDAFMLGSSEPKISETLVILDDDEDKDSLQIKIDSVVSNAPLNQSTSQPYLSNLLAKPSDPPPLLKTPAEAPKLVPIESLLQKPKEIFTGDGLLIGNPGGNYTLHPIAIKEGVTTIPSLYAKIINGQLIYEKLPLLTPVDITQLTNPLNNSSKDVISKNNNMFPQIKVFGPVRTADSNSKTTKRDLPDVAKCATPNKMTKVLPVEEQSDLEKSRIDWEDKIPMDVISYVDAVDPNRDPRMGSKTWPGGQDTSSTYNKITTYVQHTSKNDPSSSDVIDLC